MTPPPAVSSVPRRLRLICALAAALVVAVMVVVAVNLPSTPNSVVNFRLSDQVAMVGIGVLVAAAVLVLGWSTVEADEHGVHVRNMVVRHQLDWSAVTAVRFDRNSAWATLMLADDDELALLAVQAGDKLHAVRAVEGLRALHAHARARAEALEPARPPLLYDD